MTINVLNVNRIVKIALINMIVKNVKLVNIYIKTFVILNVQTKLLIKKAIVLIAIQVVKHVMVKKEIIV